MPTVNIRFFGPARDLAGCASMPMEILAGESLGALAGKIATAVPALADATGLRLAVNRAYVPLNYPLNGGEEIAVIPPVSGGSDGPSIGLIRERIEVEQIIQRLQTSAGGAIATFVGMVRSEVKGKISLAALEYHAYEEMALVQMEDIRVRGIEKFKLQNAVIIHRLGRVALAEASILVACVSAHRGEAFDACRWMVDAIKTDVPIWKKDLWSDETTGWTQAGV